MQLFEILDRMQRMDDRIRRRCTGSPEEFARQLKWSRATLYRHLDRLRSLGAEIEYSRERRSFYYANDFRLKV